MESGEYLLITICQNEINYDSKFNGFPDFEFWQFQKLQKLLDLRNIVSNDRVSR
jgi:hypothetical protein